VDTLEAATMVADRGVRIYGVGLGTLDGSTATGGEGMAMVLQPNQPTLQHVARMTGGEYHQAGTAEKLRTMHQQVGSRMQVRKRDTS
jgi:Ca-activated chloride channel family protein